VEVTFGEMEVDGGLFQITMAQQDLNGAQIRACFEKMRGKTVPQGIVVLLMIRTCQRSAIAIILAMA
jgi:hypothetical protein